MRCYRCGRSFEGTGFECDDCRRAMSKLDAADDDPQGFLDSEQETSSAIADVRMRVNLAVIVVTIVLIVVVMVVGMLIQQQSSERSKALEESKQMELVLSASTLE